MPDKFYLLKLIHNVSQNFLTGGEGMGSGGLGFGIMNFGLLACYSHDTSQHSHAL